MFRWTKPMSLLMILALLFIAACGSNNTNSSAGSSSDSSGASSDSNKQSSATKDVTITYLTIKNADHPLRMAIDEMLEEYNAKTGSSIKIDYQTTADRSSYNQKLRTLIASNKMPDWFDSDPDAYTRRLAESGGVQDFGAYLEEEGLTDSFQQVALSFQTFEGLGTYLMPTAVDMEVFWYNKQLFADAGASVPKTLDELLEASEQLKNSGITPIAVSGKEKWTMLRYLAYPPFRLANNDFINAAKTGEESFGSEVGLLGAQFLHDLGTKGYFQEGFATTDYGTAIDLFLSGKAAILNMGSWQFSSFTEQALKGSAVEGQIDYFLLPTMNNAVNKPTDIWTSGGVGIGFNKSTFEEKTRDFLNYIISEDSGYVEKVYRLGPIFPAIISHTQLETDPLYNKLLADLANVEIGGISWDVLIDPVTNELMGDLANALALGMLTPQEFADQIDASVRENAARYFESANEE
jgi:raffinose/stachyose/melibiose transport system substrate-binding protein